MCYEDEIRTFFREQNTQATDNFVTARANIRNLLPPEEAHAMNSTGASSNMMENERRLTNIKLPAIQVKPFSGRYEEFKDLFQACIGTANFSQCQKVLYLKSSFTF